MPRITDRVVRVAEVVLRPEEVDIQCQRQLLLGISRLEHKHEPRIQRMSVVAQGIPPSTDQSIRSSTNNQVGHTVEEASLKAVTIPTVNKDRIDNSDGRRERE